MVYAIADALRQDKMAQTWSHLRYWGYGGTGRGTRLTAPKTILITGASGAIGTALAYEYAGPDTQLLLFGRDQARLQDTASHCEAMGASARTWSVDLAKIESATASALEADELHPIDLLIANAGVMIPPAASSERWDDVAQTLQINVMGTLAMVVPLAQRMSARGGGQIALMSSLASYRGLPAAPAYSASKAALRAYGEGIRPRLAESSVKVSVICPGFVESAMSRRCPGPKLFVCTPEAAAARIRRSLRRNQAHIAFPFALAFGTAFVAALPVTWGDVLLRWFNGPR